MNYKIHIIPHTHWDREWYFTTSRSKVYLVEDLKNVLNTLEKNPNFTFILDGQTCLLDDYLEFRSEDFSRIKRLVKNKQLIIGPWYTQTDQLLISAESIVRNLYYGIKRAKDFGFSMMIGYVPDSFGQGGNMPQIYRDFGIEDVVFWRGVCDDEVNHTEFKWKGDDGSTVYCYQLPFGYYIGGVIPEEPKDLMNCVEEFKKKLGKLTSTRHLYLPNGFDQAPIRTNLIDIVKTLNEIDPKNEYQVSTTEDYVTDVRKESDFIDLVKGELTSAKHMRIHKSIFSSRSDIKIMNTVAQNYVVNIVEPILLMASFLGFEYPHTIMNKVWKLLFENAAHDSIGSCVSDKTNRDILYRYQQAIDLAENVLELQKRKISAAKTDTEQYTLSVFNTYATERSEVVFTNLYLSSSDRKLVLNGKEIPFTILSEKDESDYILKQTIHLNPSNKIKMPENVYACTVAIHMPKIPSLGFDTIQIIRGDSSKQFEPKNHLENEFYKITIHSDGSFDVFDKVNHHTYYNQGVIEENGDGGDSFNYSPPPTDMKIRNTENAKIHIQGNEILDQATIEYELLIPKDLEEREKGKCSLSLPIRLEISLGRNSQHIDVTFTCENKGLSHRLCALFDAGFKTSYTLTDALFGSIQRDNRDRRMDLWEKAKESWQEKPISINPIQTYAALENESQMLAIVPQGVREYETIDNQILSLTLFRTYGFMGKENLLYRPGRASGETIIATPDAQLQKTIISKFSIIYANPNTKVENIAKQILSPLECYPYAEFLNGRLIFSQEYVEPYLTDTFSIAQLDQQNLIISAIKEVEGSKDWIIRLYNASLKPQKDTLRCKADIEAIYESNLLEEKLSFITNEPQVDIQLKPNQFITLRITGKV